MRLGLLRGAGTWTRATATLVVPVLVTHLTRVEVRGESMVPTLRPGDRLLAVRGLRIRSGDLAAVADPRLPSRLLVKRVVSVDVDHRLDVVGDNLAASTDSRTFGAVPPSLVTGRVVWRYWPPERRGRISGAGSGPRRAAQ